MNRAAAYSSKGEWDRAIEDYDQALRVDPSYALAFRDRGVAYASKGEPDRVIQDYDQALRLNPNDARTLGARGNAYTRKRFYARAIQNFDQAIRLAPNDARAYRNRARARFNKGEYQAAVPDFAQAVRLEPRTPYNQLYLYLAESRTGQNGRACDGALFGSDNIGQSSTRGGETLLIRTNNEPQPTQISATSVF